MARLSYRARTFAGEVVEGQIRAQDAQAAREALSLKGLEVMTIKQAARLRRARKGVAFSLPASPFRPVSTRALATTTGQLALMLKTGTSLMECFEALAEQTSDERLTQILSAVQNEITGGATLATALAAHPRVFDGFYVSAVRSGEASGRLAEVFKQLEGYLQKRLDIRNSVATALIYPAVVSVLATFAVVFVMTFVLPKFVVIFERGGVLLPLPTRMLMAMSAFIVNYWYVIILACFAMPAAVFFYARSRQGSSMVDRLILHIPLIGPMVIVVQSSLLLRTLGTLLGAGVPLVDSLSVAHDACGNSQFQGLVSRITDGVMQGQNLSSNFAKSPLISPSIKQMIATGERSGALAMVMTSIAEYLDDVTDKYLKRLSAVMEPVILIVMGAVIGFIAISVLLPLFRLSTAVRGG